MFRCETVLAVEGLKGSRVNNALWGGDILSFPAR
jgi:hypothetical protein